MGESRPCCDYTHHPFMSSSVVIGANVAALLEVSWWQLPLPAAWLQLSSIEVKGDWPPWPKLGIVVENFVVYTHIHRHNVYTTHNSCNPRYAITHVHFTQLYSRLKEYYPTHLYTHRLSLHSVTPIICTYMCMHLNGLSACMYVRVHASLDIFAVHDNLHLQQALPCEWGPTAPGQPSLWAASTVKEVWGGETCKTWFV